MLIAAVRPPNSVCQVRIISVLKAAATAEQRMIIAARYIRDILALRAAVDEPLIMRLLYS